LRLAGLSGSADPTSPARDGHGAVGSKGGVLEEAERLVLHCATALRDAAEMLGIRVRVGIHTGEVESCGEGIAGTAVEIAVNVAALARPSEVLATRTVKDLVAGSGITFAEHGPRSLPGSADQLPLFAVGTPTT
jgi:class 3 adenylate cyclase